jgi:hypothetical protein
MNQMDFSRLQSDQYTHDKRNHFDILSLSKSDRLKHYGLHFAKYVGRFARGSGERHTMQKTIVDSFLVTLSAANTLHQRLQECDWQSINLTNDRFLAYADAAGRFADACEKIDHLESFIEIARDANRDLVSITIEMAKAEGVDLAQSIKEQRARLASRQFYIQD